MVNKIIIKIGGNMIFLPITFQSILTYSFLIQSIFLKSSIFLFNQVIKIHSDTFSRAFTIKILSFYHLFNLIIHLIIDFSKHRGKYTHCNNISYRDIIDFPLNLLMIYIIRYSLLHTLPL